MYKIEYVGGAGGCGGLSQSWIGLFIPGVPDCGYWRAALSAPDPVTHRSRIGDAVWSATRYGQGWLLPPAVVLTAKLLGASWLVAGGAGVGFVVVTYWLGRRLLDSDLYPLPFFMGV